MTDIAAQIDSLGAPEPSRDEASEHLLRRILRKPAAMVAAVWLGLVIACAVLANWISPFNPQKSDINDILANPGRKHWMGTDSAGRDVMSRLFMGSRISLLGVLLCVGLAAAIGISTGLVAGYYGGRFDDAFSWVSSVIQAMPGIVLLIAVRKMIGGSIWTAMAVFGVLISPAFFRLVNVTVRAVRNELYVDAALVSGLPDRRIIVRHVLRVVRAPIIIQAAIISSIAVAIQAGLAILNFGGIDTPTWGTLMSDGRSKMFRTRWLLMWPSVTVTLTSIALALIANTLRDELEGRKKSHNAEPPGSNGLAGLEHLPDPIVHSSEETLPVSSPLLAVRHLVVGYPDANEEHGWKRVVRGVSFDIDRGEVVGLVGESGSGKTQTAFAIMGLLPAGGRILGGSVSFDGTELVGLDDKKMNSFRGRRISYVPQEPMSNLDPSFTIGAQLVEPIRLCLGLSKAAARDRALELLHHVGIPDPKRTYGSYPHELSGGMAQRVLIAGAVSCEPDLIIADEPTTALDVTVQAEILDLLRTLQRESNTALLLVTHNFGVVADLCDRVAVMQEGRIVELGPVRSIFASPRHDYTRSLLDAILEEAPPRSAYAAPTAVRA
jgi:peptide/nickel transport system permease protein